MAESKESEVRIVITGANRGIGLEFVSQFLKRKNSTVIACCRNPGKANALNQLKEANKGRVVVAKVDVTNDEDIESLKQTVGNKPVDILLLNAGIIGKTKGPFQRSQYLEVFNVNCLGALLVGQALYDNVKLSNRKQIVGISSGAGSIADCGGGNLLPYRVSKTAMNMAFQSFAKQSEKSKDGVHTLLVNPGWVKTDMGGQSASKTVQDSVKAMLDNVIDKYESLISGGFYTYTGKPFAEDKVKNAKFAW